MNAERVAKEDRQLDLSEAQVVQVTFSENRETVWVNVDGICLLRACNVKRLELGER